MRLKNNSVPVYKQIMDWVELPDRQQQGVAMRVDREDGRLCVSASLPMRLLEPAISLWKEI